MVKRLVTIPTVSLTRVVEVDGRKVGYLFFRNFVRPSTAALNEAFAALKTAGATELVLDLRYNGGGLVDVAVHLASLIGGARTNGQVMLNCVHNDKVGPIYNKVTRFTRPGAGAQPAAAGRDHDARLGVGERAGHQSLRPYMPVTVIGDTTYGKPVGQYGFDFCDKVLVPVAFSFKNANNEGDFFDGIAADCAAPTTSRTSSAIAAEASFAEALTFIRTGACSARDRRRRAHAAIRAASCAPRLTGLAVARSTPQ